MLRDTGVCGAHGTCKFLSPGNYTCNCHKDYLGNHCHKSKFTVIFVAFFYLGYVFFFLVLKSGLCCVASVRILVVMRLLEFSPLLTNHSSANSEN